jgi:RibD C-terminal domain
MSMVRARFSPHSRIRFPFRCNALVQPANKFLAAAQLAGPNLAHSLTELGLIDEYRIYLHPVVLGHGKPYFAGPRPRLRLMTNDRIAEDVVRLTYVPA